MGDCNLYVKNIITQKIVAQIKLLPLFRKDVYIYQPERIFKGSRDQKEMSQSDN